MSFCWPESIGKESRDPEAERDSVEASVFEDHAAMSYGKEIDNPAVTRSTLSTMPPAFRERILNAMAMYRSGALKKSVIENHGSIVAAESLIELNRVDPRWWSR